MKEYWVDSVNIVTGEIFVMFVFAWLQSMSSMSLEMNRMLWFGFGYFSGVAMRRRGRVPPVEVNRMTERRVAS